MSNADNPPPGDAQQAASAAETDAVGAALATRDSIMQSLKEQHAQMFELVERQKKEAINSLQSARGMLDESRPNAPSATTYKSPRPVSNNKPANPHGRLGKACEALVTHGKTNSPALQKKIAQDMADAIAELVTTEVARHLKR